MEKIVKTRKNHVKGMETKERIYREAFKLFMRMPYELVTVREIEKEIDVTRGSIFYHLKDKRDLFEQVIERYFIKSQNLYERIGEDILEKDITFLEFIDIYITALQKKFDTLYDLAQLNRSTMTLKERSKMESFYLGFILNTGYYLDDYNEKMDANFRIDKNTWSFFIQKAIDRGEIKPNTNAKLFGELFTSIYLGKAFHDSLGKGISVKEIKELFIEIYNKIKT